MANPIRPYNMPVRLLGMDLYVWTLAFGIELGGCLFAAVLFLVLPNKLLYIMCEAVFVLMVLATVGAHRAWKHERVPYTTPAGPAFNSPECVVCTGEKDITDYGSFTRVEVDDMCMDHYQIYSDMRFGR